MTPLLLALQFMTRLPMPTMVASDEDFGKAIRWFPVAGLVVGASVALAGWLGALHSPALGALLGLIAWVAITGALHLDGLGDIADAAGAAHADRSRISEVLADPHIGSFGTTAITLQILAKFVLLEALLETDHPALVMLSPALARIGPMAWTLLLPALHSGFGTLFRRGANWPMFGCWLALWSGLTVFTCPLALAAVPVMPMWALWLRKRIGGISGDGHGAGIELIEVAALLMLVLGQ